MYIYIKPINKGVCVGGGVWYSKFPLVICFTYGNVYVSVLLSQFVPPSPSPLEPKVLVFLAGGGAGGNMSCGLPKNKMHLN